MLAGEGTWSIHTSAPVVARSLYFVSGVLVRFPYSKRLFAICDDIRAASLAIGEVLSPFRPVQAVIPGRLVSPDMDSASPWEFHLRLYCPFTCVSRIRSVIRTSGRLNCLCPFAVYLRGFRSPASRRCRASYRATRFAGYGVCKPIGFTPPAEFAFRVVESSSYLHPTLCAWCCSAPYVAAPSSRSLAIGKVLSPVQATIRVVYRLVSGATRFAGYGRWHSSRRSLLLGFHLF